MITRESTRHPLNDPLRARLRQPEGAHIRLFALRWAMSAVDGVSRLTTGRPFFAVRELERLLRDLGGLQGAEIIRAVLTRQGGTKVNAHGLENIPATGPVVIGTTHPVGTLDFLTHAAVLLEHRPDFKVVANRESERFLGEGRIIAVDLSADDRVLTASRTRAGMMEHLDAGGALLVFGSGRVPDMVDGHLVEPRWRPGITRVSEKCGAPIVPASPDLRNSRHYYRTRRIARALRGGDDNFGRAIASLRYPSELIPRLGGTFDVYYGAPLPPGTAPEVIQEAAESLAPGLYRAGSQPG